jgi:hypothetical protein
VRRISRTMFVRAAEMVRRPGLFRAESDADVCRSFAAVEWHYSDRLLGTKRHRGINVTGMRAGMVGPHDDSATDVGLTKLLGHCYIAAAFP